MCLLLTVLSCYGHHSLVCAICKVTGGLVPSFGGGVGGPPKPGAYSCYYCLAGSCPVRSVVVEPAGHQFGCVESSMGRRVHPAWDPDDRRQPFVARVGAQRLCPPSTGQKAAVQLRWKGTNCLDQSKKSPHVKDLAQRTAGVSENVTMPPSSEERWTWDVLRGMAHHVRVYSKASVTSNLRAHQ